MPSFLPPITEAAEGNGTMAKRHKTSGQELSSVQPKGGCRARLFAPYRTIGLVSPTPVPFTLIPLGKTTFQITTSVGRCLQTYDLRRGLSLVFLTRPETPGEITSTAAWKDRVYAGWESAGPSPIVGVWVFERGKKVEELEMPPGTQEPITQLLLFGTWIVGCCPNQIHVWKSATHEHYTTLHPAGPHGTGDKSLLSGCVCEMPTYLNKIFVGRRDGSVEVWNISTGKLVYTILSPSSDYGAVTALQATLTLSIVAIAFQSGPLLLHNVRTDKKIMQLNSGSLQSQPICSISFRTDGLGAGEEGRLPGAMATCGSRSGDVHLWDLNEGGRLMGVLRGAHYPRSSVSGGTDGGINKVEFLPGQPVMVTSGLDNALKSWIFDETPFSPVPRPLHSRSGHAAPVTRLTFVPSDADGVEAGGKWLLTAAKDRSLWGWSLRRDGSSTELSQGNIREKAKKSGILSKSSAAPGPSASIEDLKAPEITCIAMSLNRDGGIGSAPYAGPIWSNARTVARKKRAGEAVENDMTGWESVITGHKNEKTARTWFWGRRRAGRWAFETGDGGNVTSVAVTACGTFALVGSSLGSIDMYNLQSGLHRQRYPAKTKAGRSQSGKSLEAHATKDEPESRAPSFGSGSGKHNGPVSGIVVDAVNRTVISSGLDGKLKFWHFQTGLLSKELDWFPPTSITALSYHPPNDLVALSCEDKSIRVVDIETRKLARELRGCVATINDFCFSNDGRWIVASSADSIIRVWDLPTGHLIDAVRVPSPCTALAFSNTGEFLATAHADSVGVSIWSNRSLFTHVPTRPITESELAEMQNPTPSGEGGANLIEAAYDEVEDEEVVVDATPTGSEQLHEQLTSLSLVPKSRWQTLVQLDLIRQRNKPKEAPKVPEKAPFFLPSLSSLDGSKPDKASSRGDVENEAQLSVAEQSRIMKLSRVGDGGSERPFTVLLQAGARSGNFADFISHLKILPPAAADLEIRSLSRDADNTKMDERILFVTALTDRLCHKQDYELVQAWMTVFLRVHGGDIVSADGAPHGPVRKTAAGSGDWSMASSRNENEAGTTANAAPSDDSSRAVGAHANENSPAHPQQSLVEALRRWRTEQEREAKRLASLTGYCAGVIGFLRTARG